MCRLSSLRLVQEAVKKHLSSAISSHYVDLHPPKELRGCIKWNTYGIYDYLITFQKIEGYIRKANNNKNSVLIWSLKQPRGPAPSDGCLNHYWFKSKIMKFQDFRVTILVDRYTFLRVDLGAGYRPQNLKASVWANKVHERVSVQIKGGEIPWSNQYDGFALLFNFLISDMFVLQVTINIPQEIKDATLLIKSELCDEPERARPVINVMHMVQELSDLYTLAHFKWSKNLCVGFGKPCFDVQNWRAVLVLYHVPPVLS